MLPKSHPVDPAASAARSRQRAIERFLIGLLFATMLIRVVLIWNEWGFEDVNAYLGAAHRLRDGEPLYAGNIDPDSYRVFRYAPWFAWIWVPLSYLPKALVTWGWGAILAGASAVILLRLAQLRQPAAWALAFVLTPWLLSLVQVGNIQPLVVAMLAFGISRRSGPLWIGIAASLKGVPLLFGLVYLARREWMRIGLMVVAAAILLAPLLLYDLSGYQTDPGRSFSLYYYVSPMAWAAAAGTATLVALLLAVRRSPYVYVACAIAVMLLAPRTHVTYATYLVVGLLNGGLDRIGGDARQD
ncbi:MAG TPA: glycosyltransferase family 87 protein [Gemmatimonadales bacterium]|nr:glycosyltransferase family 87 protein [Gemmatimonadales bacterium]HLE58696.1 glycosyltransferase family 87 protein [Candidatus Limnocylindria bacterium]